MVDPVSIVTLVDLCLKYGKEIVQIFSAYMKAESKFKERKSRFDNYWIRTKIQLQLLKDIHDTLGEEHQDVQQTTLEILSTKLLIARDTIAKCMIQREDESVIRKFKYAFSEQKIDKALQELELWQDLFDPSWFLIVRAESRRIDEALESRLRDSTHKIHNPLVSARLLRSAFHSDPSAKVEKIPIFQLEEHLNSLQLSNIPLSSALIGERPDSQRLPLVLERLEPSPGTNLEKLEKDIEDLGRKLRHSDALKFGLLNCKGIVRHDFENPDESNRAKFTALTFLFYVPAGFSQPRSLRKCLNSITRPDSLSDRLNIARDLVRAVNYVHVFGFVHKNMRPETILLLKGGFSSIGSAFLIGFDKFRAADGETLRQGDSAWERSLYQHPDRMGISPKEDFIMQHDIYSLGVCLLEVGLWQSFVNYDDVDKSFFSSSGQKPRAIRTSLLGMHTQPSSFKGRLLSLAREELKTIMGSCYSEVVETCLTCLDPGNLDFGDERAIRDENGILVGVRYIEKVCAPSRVFKKQSLKVTQVSMRLNAIVI
ncbi:hypothetical protein ETB97_004338 [Aspergillus alliaceus]|uniref:Protein kinase domain-containing protein n=1 Tax=Petromyces alliaceus TaxID=209559 RepID=A0A8H6E3W9_PETAA|nr:hypothetical protein ETB97_004338 [Aspergillus burnettii]